MGLEEKITLELIKRWHSGDPQAERELLFESGLFDAYSRRLYKFGEGFYQRLRWTNPWLPGKVKVSAVDVESYAKDALLQVWGELKRRPEEPASVEEFLHDLDLQTKRRLKDLLIKEIQRVQGMHRLDIPPDEDTEKSDELEMPLERLLGRPSLQTDPEKSTLHQQYVEILEQLFIKFRKALQRRPKLQRHFDVVMMCFALCYSDEEPLNLLARIFEFLNPEGKHHEEVARCVLDHCCKNRNTYDSAHNRRLRQEEWPKFLDGEGKKDFEALSCLR